MALPVITSPAYDHRMQIDMKGFARAGAQVRLAELMAEIKVIHRAFPGLDGGKPGGRRSNITTDGDGPKDAPVRRRRRMSAAERKAVGERMKKYWAARRKAGVTPSAGATAQARPARTAASPRRTMSAEAKARISAAQKKRWAAQKRGAKKR
jgi:hypothetical protein